MVYRRVATFILRAFQSYGPEELERGNGQRLILALVWVSVPMSLLCTNSQCAECAAQPKG